MEEELIKHAVRLFLFLIGSSHGYRWWKGEHSTVRSYHGAGSADDHRVDHQ